MEPRTDAGEHARPPAVFHRSLVEFLEDLPQAARWFWALVVAVGVVAGLGAVALLYLLRAIETLAWHGGEGGSTFLAAVTAASPLRRVLVPTVAGALVAVLSLVTRQPLGGHGTAGIIEAIWLRAGRLRLTRALVRAAVSIVAVAMGASLGREGALIQTGAAAASKLGRVGRVPPHQARLLVACGAAAGIAAAYNVPIGGALFSLEVLLGSFALELFGPIVVSSVVATLISRALVANHPSYLIPHYALMSPGELLRAVFIGPLMGVASALYIVVIDRVAQLADRVPRKLAPLMPVAAMAALGVASLWLPELLGNGYDTVNASLLSAVPLMLLVALPLAKLVATATCAGAGVPGGLFTPSLFYGALLGGAYGALTQRLGGGAPPGAYALLGMGAMLAGTTHASVSAVLIIFELTGDYGLILPLMLGCVVAAGVSRRLVSDSLYTCVLRRRNVQLPEMPRPHWLRTRRVRDVVIDEAERVPPETPVREVVLRLLNLPAGRDLYVVGPDGKLLGVIDLDALAHIPVQARERLATAADVMDTQVHPVRIDQSVADAAAAFAETELERLPVVTRDRELIGTLAKREVLRVGQF